MTAMTMAPRATAQTPLRARNPAALARKGERPAQSRSVPKLITRLCAVASLAAGFQVLTPGSAAVSTLPVGGIALPQATVGPRGDRLALPRPRVLDGALVTAILSEAFPRAVQRSEPAAEAPPADPNEIMQFGSRRAPRWLVETILKAAQTAGVDPVYLMTLADIESSLSHRAKASTSSAEGLFQFIDRTWLETLHIHGAAYGFAAAAEAIRIEDDEPVLVNDGHRAWIMGLRRDPYLSALMAGELIKDVARALRSEGERELTEAELYLAHFFGAQSAVRFLNALDETPNASASKLFPRAAKANLGLFSERQGRKRRSVSVAELYEKIDSKIVRRLNAYDPVGAESLKPIIEASAPVR